MRYRVEFEHAEIKHCWDCPMLMSEAGAEKVDYCIGMGLVVETAKGIPDICPLEVSE